jgi:uncharacterized membrane protein YphA (DoxX/SURF4 family)
MIQQGRGQQAAGSAKAQAIALMLIRISTGVYLFFIGLNKVRWLLDSTPLAAQLAVWSSQPTPMSHWYLERITPGTPVFARLIPLAEMAGGLALAAGFWTRLVAGAMFLMVLNFQIAAGAMFSYAFLTNAKGLPLLGSLLGLALGGARLPLSYKQ